ncbi:hypothetical protein E2C01_087453 [Portunus trituberculatus]|uniref:Uncharacterized protein n=1 Tax=Portunus trituberculatus TaxID=210409 RepID=A0A5B7JGD7_PORTR|nr:hypothetical protein [Portunus trituberculatus]
MFLRGTSWVKVRCRIPGTTEEAHEVRVAPPVSLHFTDSRNVTQCCVEVHSSRFVALLCGLMLRDYAAGLC